VSVSISASWIVVLAKDFDSAKSRLGLAMSPQARREMAVENACLALTAARETAPTLAVCGSLAVAAMAKGLGVEVLVETVSAGQNAAAAFGLADIAARNAVAALLLSSDLPLVTADAIRKMMQRAERTTGPLVIAAPALGREGTNALFLRPPQEFSLHFGHRSLPRFAEEARRTGRAFMTHDDLRLALDIDEPSDLTALSQLRTR